MLSRLDISAEAVRNNYRQFCRVAGKHRVAPVLKANAYGHGLKQIYDALKGEGMPWLCVNYLTEAKALRDYGFTGRILIVGPPVERDLPFAAEIDAEMTLGNPQVVDAWIKAKKKCRIHVKVDTGLSRQGFLPSEIAPIAESLKPHKDKVVGIATHFANVEDVTEHAYADHQLAEFQKAKKVFEAAGFSLLAHAAASAPALILAASRFDLVRVGISLYGVWPSSITRVSYLQLNDKVLDLKPVARWITEVTTVKAVKAGQYIGYGCTFRSIRDMRIAVLPVGYYEGYPRIAGENASYVLIRGKRCPLVGRICMNMMMVDVTHLDRVEVGDPVTLIGEDGGDQVSAGDVAGWSKTIHYELLSRIHPEIPRQLTD
jgi:alanine racemase